jgi:hypothetical protein
VDFGLILAAPSVELPGARRGQTAIVGLVCQSNLIETLLGRLGKTLVPSSARCVFLSG